MKPKSDYIERDIVRIHKEKKESDGSLVSVGCHVISWMHMVT